jgi:hypothetical protein
MAQKARQKPERQSVNQRSRLAKEAGLRSLTPGVHAFEMVRSPGAFRFVETRLSYQGFCIRHPLICSRERRSLLESVFRSGNKRCAPHSPAACSLLLFARLERKACSRFCLSERSGVGSLKRETVLLDCRALLAFLANDEKPAKRFRSPG